ncbi:response regulator [Desertivirga xinjiangensis]|uniref:response regulator n=1 Tax=Desertivirga xinjiangensis TaxID=539206 RepID=UPI00210DB45A|nr:response regulator [Pedobacter xinjiangensis]
MNTKKILVVDDDPAILDSVEVMLDFEGFGVSKLSKGSDVLALTDDLPDLILLDIWLSGEDGKEICKQLKAKPQTRGIPIILVSASRELEKSAKEAGADDFLAKPFEMNVLISKINLLTGNY